MKSLAPARVQKVDFSHPLGLAATNICGVKFDGTIFCRGDRSFARFGLDTFLTFALIVPTHRSGVVYFETDCTAGGIDKNNVYAIKALECHSANFDLYL